MFLFRGNLYEEIFFEKKYLNEKTFFSTRKFLFICNVQIFIANLFKIKIRCVIYDRWHLYICCALERLSLYTMTLIGLRGMLNVLSAVCEEKKIRVKIFTCLLLFHNGGKKIWPTTITDEWSRQSTTNENNEFSQKWFFSVPQHLDFRLWHDFQTIFRNRIKIDRRMKC